MLKHFHRTLLACSLLAALAGCHSSSTEEQQSDPSVPPPPEGVNVQVIQDKQLRLLTPTVEFNSGVMNITGYVQRRPGFRGVITGRIDIDVVDSDGNDLDWIPALLFPHPIPSEGKGESGYIIHYGWIPPAGSVIKVRFADSKTAALEDSGDYDPVGGAYGRKSGGTGGGHGHGGGGHRSMGHW